jgi:hypothetical protein
MPLKTAEVKPLPVTLQTSTGAPVSYASKSDLLAGGWTFEYWSANAEVASPTWTWTVVDATTGKHEIGLTVDGEQGVAYLYEPSGFTKNVDAWMIDSESTNLADILGAINTSAGQPAAEDRALITDISVTEGDSLQRTLTVPLAAISDFGLTDLSTVTAVSGAARTSINRIDTSPDFTFSATILDTSARTIAVSWASMPTGASISGFAITAVSTSSKTFTLSGDKRSFFDGITRLIIANSTGNDGFYSIVSMALTGGATVITVSETPASSTADGTLAQADESKEFKYDVQIQFPKAFAITAVATGTRSSRSPAIGAAGSIRAARS